jgi:hypothetical protein
VAERAARAQFGPDEAHEGSGPRRLCAVTRAELPVADLLRFVAAPDGAIVPDPGAKLPGRGVWLTCDRRVVAEAVRTKAFARSLKRQVLAGADLPDKVEALLLARAQGALSIANKAGLVTSGYAQVDALLASEVPKAVLHASDGASGGKEKLDRRAAAISRDRGIPVPILDPLTIEQMSLAIGRANVVHAALKQGGASEKFLSEAGRLVRYRHGCAGCDGAWPETGSSLENENAAAHQSGVNGTTHE